MKNKNMCDLPDTWKKPFLFWWFLLVLSTTDLQTSTCGCRCVLGMWCDANVGRRGIYICESPNGPYNTPTRWPSTQGRCLLSCSSGPKGQDPDREERQRWPSIAVGGDVHNNNNTADETIKKKNKIFTNT